MPVGTPGASGPRTRYAKSGPFSIAYQVVGDGPFDLLYIPGWVSNCELAWEEPRLARFLGRLASFSRLILFDKRGTGMSDRVSQDDLPTLEERMDDVNVVLRAAGSDRAALLCESEGGSLGILFAATYPERTLALVTAGVFAKRLWSPEYPWAPTAEERAREIEDVERSWGVDVDIEHYAPSLAGDAAFKERVVNYLRRSASPGAAVALMRMNTQIDVRAVLPTIAVPTLMMHRTGDRDSKLEEGRWIASQIPGARFVEQPGEDHIPWLGDQDRLLDEVQEFLTGARPARQPERVLATVVFTDIVGSTERAVQMGDRAWRELLERHHRAVRVEIARYRGREIDTAGDGFLAAFDGPGRAVRAAWEMRDRVRDLGLEIRAGVHTGECEVVGEKLGGIAVHIGARVAAQAEAGEILVSSTVKDLVAGSGIQFRDRGVATLKGLPGEWRLFSVEGR